MERITERVYEYGRKTVYLHDNVEKAVKKLAKYEDEEEQGLLIHLPCKVGDRVYAIEDDCNRPSDCGYSCEKCPDGKKSIYSMDFSAELIDDIGKTVFLTHKEAEQKLKELQKEGENHE